MDFAKQAAEVVLVLKTKFVCDLFNRKVGCAQQMRGMTSCCFLKEAAEAEPRILPEHLLDITGADMAMRRDVRQGQCL